MIYMVVKAAVPIISIDNWNKAVLQINGSEGDVFDPNSPNRLSVDKSVRSCEVRFIMFNKHRKIYQDIFNNIFPHIEYYQSDFNVDIYRRLEIQHTTYQVGGHYEAHNDINIATKNVQRKLSLVLMSSDRNEYEGGELTMVDKKLDLEKGDMVIFNPNLVHSVLPVTNGIRKTLVMWVPGPAWR